MNNPSCVSSANPPTSADANSNFRILQAALALLHPSVANQSSGMNPDPTISTDISQDAENVPRKRKFSMQSNADESSVGFGDDTRDRDSVQGITNRSVDDERTGMIVDIDSVCSKDYKSRRSAKNESKASRREERNKREKERSSKLSMQIYELRELLSAAGVKVPKGTKGSVLSEAAKYIKVLQQQQSISDKYVIQCAFAWIRI